MVWIFWLNGERYEWESSTGQRLKDALYDCASEFAEADKAHVGITTILAMSIDGEETIMSPARLKVCQNWFINKIDALYNEFQTGNYREKLRVV